MLGACCSAEQPAAQFLFAESRNHWHAKPENFASAKTFVCVVISERYTLASILGKYSPYRYLVQTSGVTHHSSLLLAATGSS